MASDDDAGGREREDFPIQSGMNRPGDDYGRLLIIGIMDILVALGVELDKRGLISRAEIATLMDGILAQQHAADPVSAGDRGVPAGVLRAFFRIPVFTGKPN